MLENGTEILSDEEIKVTLEELLRNSINELDFRAKVNFTFRGLGLKVNDLRVGWIIGVRVANLYLGGHEPISVTVIS